MTCWLLHFTRETEQLNARDVLHNILKEGVLRPGFAKRRVGQPRTLRPTIYGPHPAVCFSEQPLNAFTQYLHDRNDQEAMSGYGILIDKRDVYAAGGLPVIYGLRHAEELGANDQEYEPQKRLLRPEDLPIDLQYRYVVFVPTEDNPKDWTHEREWRWPANSSIISSEPLFYLGPNRYSGTNRLIFESRIHVFVNRNKDIVWLQKKLTDAYVRNQVGLVPYSRNGREKPYSYYWRENLKYVKIVSLDQARENRTQKEFWRFDDWPEKDKHPLLLPDLAD